MKSAAALLSPSADMATLAPINHRTRGVKIADCDSPASAHSERGQTVACLACANRTPWYSQGPSGLTAGYPDCKRFMVGLLAVTSRSSGEARCIGPPIIETSIAATMLAPASLRALPARFACPSVRQPGDPAKSQDDFDGPIALRPRLTTGLPFRGCRERSLFCVRDREIPWPSSIRPPYRSNVRSRISGCQIEPEDFSKNICRLGW